MGYGMTSGAMDGAMMEEQGGALAQLMAKLPMPVQVLLQIFAVMALAAIIGVIIGKMYASIKYPDPEKHHIISPKLKVLFICILAACCFWLYTTMTDEEIPPETAPGTEEQQAAPEGEDLPVIANDDSAAVAVG